MPEILVDQRWEELIVEYPSLTVQIEWLQIYYSVYTLLGFSDKKVVYLAWNMNVSTIAGINNGEVLNLVPNGLMCLLSL